MFGHLLLVVKQAVTQNYGAQKWIDLLRKCGQKGEIDDLQQYDDKLLEKLLDHIPDICGCSKLQIMALMGEAYLRRLERSGHAQFLRLLGSSFLEFMENLDFTHSLAQAQYPHSAIPHFRVDEDSTGAQMRLHYYSHRKFLSCMVEELLKAIGREYFDKNLVIRIESESEEVVGRGERRWHIVYSIAVMDLTKVKTIQVQPTMVAHTRKHGEVQIREQNVEEQRQKIELIKEQFGEDALPLNRARTLKTKWRAAVNMSMLHSRNVANIPRSLSIGPREFCEVFPYHIVFDEAMKLKQAGVQIQAVITDFRSENTNVADHLKLIHPGFEEFNFANCRHFIDCPHIFKVKKNKLSKEDSPDHSFLLRGQMIELHDTKSMLYLCSPYVRQLDDLEARGMHISDLPHHDLTKYLLAGQSLTGSDWLDATTGKAAGSNSHRRRSSYKVNGSVAGTDSMDDDDASSQLSTRYAMVPTDIANIMRAGSKVTGELYKSTTVLFCDIVHFGQIVKSCSPDLVIDMLNDLHRRFDYVTYVHNVFKVDVIGDAYVIVAGIPKPAKNDAERIVNVALSMLYLSRKTPCPYNYGQEFGRRCLIRIGVHSGPVMGGVIGTTLPRFMVMGESVVMASRMESHGIPDRVHISETTQKELPTRKFQLEERGSIEIRGKGRFVTFFVNCNLDASDDMLVNRADLLYDKTDFPTGSRSNRKVAPEPWT